ncbi:MAG: hypothetical protein DWQ07_03025 [Chloroflexi bacterium]|nr:MAG: hypothetical protein DWQ07_03025 [Chloroflexota bacterium]
MAAPYWYSTNGKSIQMTMQTIDDQIIRRALTTAFPGIRPSDADFLIKSGEVKQVPASTVVCAEGEVEYTFYVILDGEFRVSKVINDDEDRQLNQLHPGAFFGEMAIIDNAPRAATVASLTDATVLEIHKGVFEKALQDSPSMSQAMMREVSKRLRDNDELAIEDLRQKAKELADAYQQLAELESARQEFLTTIAHELRTPLTSASGFMQMVRLGMFQGDDAQGALETVGRNIDIIVSLTNDILFLQEMDLILADFEPVDMQALVAAAVEAEREHAEKYDIQVNVSAPDDLPAALGDATSLERVVVAVLNNAIKFSSIGRAVDVSLAYVSPHVVLTVIDEGIGITEEMLPRIYDRFVRLEEFEGRLFGGVGLGLSIAKEVIDQHEGSIEVESKSKQGATVKVLLKAANQD